MCTWCWRKSNAKEKFGLQNVAKERLSVIYIQDFWATCACPKKTRVALKCFTVWKYFYHSEFLNNLRLPWKTRVALIFFTVLKNFYHSGFLSNWRLPWKQSLPWNFSSPEGRPAPPTPHLVRLWLYCSWATVLSFPVIDAKACLQFYAQLVHLFLCLFSPHMYIHSSVCSLQWN